MYLPKAGVEGLNKHRMTSIVKFSVAELHGTLSGQWQVKDYLQS